MTTEIAITKTAEEVGSRSLQVTVPVERVSAAERRALSYYAKRARLPGFRAGKAPEGVVRKRYGDAIRQAVVEELLRAGWDAAREQEGLEPIADPSIRNLKFEPGAPMEFELVVEVKPDVTLARTGGFTVEKPAVRVDDDAVAAQLERLREQKGSWLPVEDAAPVPGNLVRLEVTSLEEGADPAPQAHTVVLGEGQAIPDLEERVMALRPGETVEAPIRFPDDHPDETKRGVARTLRIALLEVKRRQLPDLDDGFARELGDFDGLDALRAAVREDLEKGAAREADARVRDQLIQQLVEANGVPAPAGLVHRLLHAYAGSWDVPADQFERFAQEFTPIAEAQVRRDLVLDAVVRAQGLAATEAELDARVARIAEASGRPAGEVYASLQKGGRLRELEHALTEEKAFAWLLEQSTVNEVTP